MKKLTLLAILQLFISCTGLIEKPYVQHYEYIAHAGGAIGGYTYTNSRESLDSAQAKGYRYIEIDLSFTTDSILIAAHSWEKFNSMTGFSHLGCEAPSTEEFMSRRIHNNYTPMTADDIHQFFMQNKELYLVTDKISDPEVLAKYFPGLKERMVVEAFSYEDYIQLRKEGYYRVLYSCMANDLESTLTKHMLLDFLFPGDGIDWIALHTDGFDNKLFKLLYNTCDFKIALFTIDNLEEIEEEYIDRVFMIYTNNLPPIN